MPTINLSAASVGTADQWSNVGGADKMDSVNIDDGDTKYITTSQINKAQYFNHSGMPAASAITWHGIRNKARRSAGAAGTKINNVLYYGGNTSSEDKGVPAAGYTTYESVNLPVPGGGTWSSSIVNNTQMGIATQAADGDTIRDTYMMWQIQYVPVSGGYMWLLAQWLPPILAVASHCLTKLEIARVLSSLKIQPSDKEDFARIIEAFRRRPRWV